MQIKRRFISVSNRVLCPLGIELKKTWPGPWFTPDVVTTRVGGFEIKVPGINPISTHYEHVPDYMAYLKNLCILVKEKYSDTAAIDVGANVGDTACIMRSAVPDLPILCIEGDEFTYRFLEKNLSQLPGTSSSRSFLSDRTETLSVGMSKAGWNTTLLPKASNPTAKVSVSTLDDLLAGRKGDPPYKLIKVDAEGFDCKIIRGARRLLMSSRPVITFEYNRDTMRAAGEAGLDTLAMLADCGYSRVSLHDCAGRFFCGSDLLEAGFLHDIHRYADGANGLVYYFDFTVFHSDDSDIADKFIAKERTQLDNSDHK